MIDYETYCKIKDCHERQHLTIAQTARALGLHAETVAKWVHCPQYHARQAVARSSRLDPFKDRIVSLLERHPYSAQQIFQRLREEGYAGGPTIVKDYVRRVRPVRREAFLKLDFVRGECAQLDWGLCRARHRPHYAASPNMPSTVKVPLLGAILILL